MGYRLSLLQVPFQVVCVFLAMDVRESLSHIVTALRVLEEVAQRFQTVAMKEALKTARFLVRLSKKRKDEDSEVLSLSLKKDTENGDPQPENMQRLEPSTNQLQKFGGTPMTTSSSNDDWSLDLLSQTDFDWNFFLTADLPFNGFAPDGIM